ncbi:MAG: hypothetical protein IKW95_03135 [Lachnospiraceae bacterium]|nr:hypothetical protein [Lachnospiraceae bacterium]
MSNNGGRGGDGGGHGLVFWIVLIVVIAAVCGGTFAQDLVKQGLGFLKTAGIILGVLLLALIAFGISFAVWSERKDKKLKEEQMKLDILNTPLETFGESETQQLMDKYDGKEPSAQSTQQSGQKTGSVNPYSAVKNPYAKEEQKQTGV